MKVIAIFLIVFWIIIIVFPKILAILIWGFFVFIWVNLFFISRAYSKGWSKWKWDYVKVGKYKIYK